MKIHFTYILFFSCLFFSNKTIAQTFICKGIVQDAHTKEPILFASVYFSKSGIGTSTDSAGNFSFTLDQHFTDTLVVSYVGYELNKTPVNFKDSNQLVRVQLQREESVFQEAVVKIKFNKGLYLWKKILSKKNQYNRYNLPNFKYEAYNKLEIDIKNFNAQKAKRNVFLKPFAFVFDNIDSTSEKEPFLPAYLVESLSDYVFQLNPKRYYENIKAINTKGFKNESISKLLGVLNQNVSIYSDYVNVMDKDYISPFKDNADNYYHFSVPDTQIINGKKLFHFVFTPKRPGQNTFQGDAWVFAQTYQIQKISLYLGKDANINYIDRISVFQEFIPINDSIYFLNRDKFFADFKVLGKHSLTLIGRKTTSYKNISINNDSIPALLKNQTDIETIKTNSNINNFSDEDWDKLRHDTLSTNEKKIYATTNKLLQMPKFQNFQKNLGFLATGYRKIGKFEIGPWFNWVSNNSWEGTRFRFDLGTNNKLFKNIYLHAYAAYGTLDKRIKGKAEAFWIVARSPHRTRLHLSYIDDIELSIAKIGEISEDNIFTLAIRKPNTSSKFLNFKDLSFEVKSELGKGFSTEFFLSHREYTPLKNLPFKNSYTVTNGGEPLNSFEAALRFRYAYLEKFIEGDLYRISLGTTYPVVELTLAKAFPGVLQSAYSYSKVSASVQEHIKISPYGTISYKVYGGKIFGTVPFTFLENHRGNNVYYYNPSAYN